MELIGKAVPDRNACVFRQFFNYLLPETAILDTVIHPAQYPGRIFHGFLFPHLRAGRIQIGNPCALVVCRNLKGAPGPGGGFFKNKGDVLAGQSGLLCSSVFCLFQINRKIEQEFDFAWTEIQKL